MQKQNFENRVQQKMEELVFTPSAPVWQNIEEALKKKKDRRRIVLWVLPLGILCAGIIALGISYPFKQPLSSALHKHTITSIENRNGDVKSSSAITGKRKEKKHTIQLSTEKSTGPSYSKNDEDIAFHKLNKRLSNSNHLHFSTAPGNKKDTVLLKSNNNPDRFKNKIPGEFIIASDEDIALDRIADKVPLYRVSSGKEVITSVISPASTINITSQLLPKQPGKKWNFIFQSGIGLSGITTAANTSGYYSIPASNSQPGTGGSYYQPPSQATNGFSFSAGISLNKLITRNGSFYTGLQYHYYSTHIKVGQRVIDTFSSNTSSFADLQYAYRNIQQVNTYRNEYHFIELPLGYSYTFLKNKLQLNAGITIAQLINSKALQYNSTYNIYYKDNSELVKTQYGATAGLIYKTSGRKKRFFSAGPHVQYGINNLLKNNSPGYKQHLFFTGLQTAVSF